MITFEGLELGFGDDPPVLQDLNLSLPSGTALGIIGPPSVGKSVLLKAVAGLLRPRRGALRVGELDLTVADERALRTHRRSIGMLFQNTALFDSLSIFENVAFPLRRSPTPPPEEELRARVQGLLEAVSLPKAGPLPPHALSGGMQKRAGIARAVAARPRLRLFDEPTAGLDPVTAARILTLINRLHVQDPEGITLVVSNEMDTVLAAFPRVLMLARGGVLFDGPSVDIRERRAPAEVVAFVRGDLTTAAVVDDA